jgi:glycosyltransferase involved in cell wall biosynthesis
VKRSPRVLLIGRRFWPHGSSDSACFLTELACAIRRGGMHVEVLTPRYASSWPEELVVREIPIHRPAAAPRSDWSIGRYLRHLTSWLQQHAQSFDALLVDAIREEAIAVTEVGKQLGIPVVLRCGGWGDNSDPKWWKTGRSAKRSSNVAKNADAIVAKSGINQRELIAEGFIPEKVHRINQGFPAFPPRTALTRQAARATLGNVNTDLITSEQTPVLLCTSSMTRGGGVNLLVNAAPHLIKRYPDLRLWFIGDGPYRDWIYESLRGHGIRASIAMPGTFSDFADLCQAADLFLQPDDEGLDFFLPTAVSAELPLVCLRTPSSESLLCQAAADHASIIAASRDDSQPETTELVQWIDAATAKQTRLAVLRVLDDMEQARHRAAELRRHLLCSRPQTESVQSYMSLLQSLAHDRPRTSSSTETVS